MSPMHGLAMMAWVVAWNRMNGPGKDGKTYIPSISPAERGGISRASPEYYRIIDSIARSDRIARGLEPAEWQ